MISVYAQYFIPTKASGFSTGDTEQLLWSIPNQNGRAILPLDARVNNEIGGAGNFEFSLAINNPYYGIWKQMKTIVRVDYDGDTIFYGRVLTIDRDMFRTKRIHCEGALTFLMDSVFEGTQNGTNETLNAYLVQLMNAHNNCMGSDSPEKKFVLSEVPGKKDEPNPDTYHYSIFTDSVQQVPNDTQKYAKNKGYKTVKEWMEELVQDYGGFLRMRYAPTSDDPPINLRLDWLKMYFNGSNKNQSMTVLENTLDMSDTTEVDNIFTYVIPVGKNNKYMADAGGGGGGGSGGGGEFSVIVTKVGMGTASASPSACKKGTTVTLTASPASGYQFVRWEVFAADFHQDPSLSGSTFIMPECTVTARAVFEVIGGENPDNH